MLLAFVYVFLVALENVLSYVISHYYNVTNIFPLFDQIGFGIIGGNLKWFLVTCGRKLAAHQRSDTAFVADQMEWFPRQMGESKVPFLVVLIASK